MLAPPPEGTFDIDEESLPIKNSSKDATPAPEQIPLLTEEAEPKDSNNPKRGKVRINWIVCVQLFVSLAQLNNIHSFSSQMYSFLIDFFSSMINGVSLM